MSGTSKRDRSGCPNSRVVPRQFNTGIAVSRSSWWPVGPCPVVESCRGRPFNFTCANGCHWLGELPSPIISSSVALPRRRDDEGLAGGSPQVQAGRWNSCASRCGRSSRDWRSIPESSIFFPGDCVRPTARNGCPADVLPQPPAAPPPRQCGVGRDAAADRVPSRMLRDCRDECLQGRAATAPTAESQARTIGSRLLPVAMRPVDASPLAGRKVHHPSAPGRLDWGDRRVPTVLT